MTAGVSVQAVDVSKERIYLDTTESSMMADDLPQVVPDGFPRYHFFLFKHTFEGDYQESVGTFHEQSSVLFSLSQHVYIENCIYSRVLFPYPIMFVVYLPSRIQFIV